MVKLVQYKKLWAWLIVVFVASFAVLLYYGAQIYQEKPPIPNQIVTDKGDIIYTKSDILDGQGIWKRMGGQEVGSVWGHGAYVAPDWTADGLHRELVFILDRWSMEKYGANYDDIAGEQQAVLKYQLKEEIRTNTYNKDKDEIVVSAIRAEAMNEVKEHYMKLFGDDPSLAEYREQIALTNNTIASEEDRSKIAAFFFWATWSTSTNREGMEVTYTNNWPGEQLIDNEPSNSLLIWSILSVILLLAAVGGMIWYYAVLRGKEDPAHEAKAPEEDPLLNMKSTPSMQATLKYFWVVAALIVVQVGLGVITAHYAVEGTSLFGIPIAEWFPYATTRTWHQQLAIFWIATAWLATGLYIGPAISGHEPKYQKLGVNFLFICLLIIVVGSMVGEWLAVKGYITSLSHNFYFGHQGFEYIDLGRAWQIFLAVGLFVWFILIARAIWPAIKRKSEDRHMLVLFLIASIAIPIFYMPGLMWGPSTHMTIVSYWQWWVVHLWVEGFFEVFAAVVIAFLFARMGLVRTITATATVLFSTTIYLAGGIIGTFHHLYFAGTPEGVLAFGAVFSALEVVPLLLIGMEAYENLRHGRAKVWVARYRWPIYFFVAVSFWNLLGAGVFGFLINPPIALYYMQGLNLTALHAHMALFGVYGMLGIGLLLFCLRGLTGKRAWKTKLLGFSFWSLNIGLMAMGLLSLLPVGVLQTVASMEHGMWYARSAEFLHLGYMQKLVWLRVLGDTIFSVGVGGLVWFIIGLKTGKSYEDELQPVVNRTK
jgi:nitric oxide reductase subunit B